MAKVLSWVNLRVKFLNYNNNNFYLHINMGQWLTRPMTQALPQVDPKIRFENYYNNRFYFLY